MNKKEFIQYALPFILEAAKNTKVDPAVMLARALIETGDGRGNFATKELHKTANNFFGITAQPGYKGKRILIATWEGREIKLQPGEVFLGKEGNRWRYKRWFRAYNSPLDSFKDFVKLMHTERYKRALQAPDAVTQAQMISEAGYATAPNAKALFVSLTQEAQNAMQKIKNVIKTNPGTTGAVALLLGVGVLYALTR